MRTKQQLYKMGVLSLIERVGGVTQMLQQISDAQTTGKITKKQAYDLRVAVNNAAKCDDYITTPNEAILELDEKIKQAVKFFR